MILATLLLALPALPGGAPSAAPAQEIPRNDGWVTDLAGVLTKEQESSLEALMESYRQGSSGNEIAVLIVPELGGQSIERLALETARAWGIGSKETSNGALLVVSMADRKLRIEVGRGLEGRLTDLISGRIIRDVIAPEFKKGHVYEGLLAGIKAMHAAAGGDYASLRRAQRKNKAVEGGLGCLSMLVAMFVLFVILRGGRRGGGGGLGSFLTWMLVARALGSGGRSRGGFGGGGFGGGGGGFGGGGFGGFGGGGGFSGGGASGGW